ncbi:MAG: hypothetical protein A3H96_06025 [Acidobacteria bacterium RIFCSPLOWO2_02_FULL_67_36]|nr:MAG: hypothetical protein A3H96_06025 [Acidobacteria bacterium RIFCSPLOWO2_02_FULL_67_36]OFW20193.1 MAG: hypothetical protein A3G21_26335 [Acidobacteria bacterium RIFCSPLOWO2_12_FULL_66_21]
MLTLRYAAVVALTLWVGGLVALGAIAAPSIFDVSALRVEGPAGRLLAGAIFGETLRRFHLLTYAAAAVLLISLLTRAVLGPRPRRFAVRVAIAFLMTAATVYAGLVLAPRIGRTQAEIGAAPSTLAETDPRRVEFERLHGASSGLELVPLAGGLLLLFWELKD